jgi:4-amino-4-deoxy-L-arabinose transferase-like glycosyltransferase
MYLAEGLVAFGGAVLWKRGKLVAILPMILGCLIAMATRPYVGWFLTGAAAAIVLHASLTRQRGLRSFALTATCVLLVVALVPVVWDQSSNEKLKELQLSQNANARDDSNLSLERVDYSTREKLIINLPTRIGDIISRPYPWQTENTSQQLGAIGTLVVLVCLALLAVAIARNRKQIMNMAGPLVYPAAFMLVAYAISAGNAGTAYRYRTHIVGLAVCLVMVLLAHRRQEQEGPARVPRRPGLGPVKRTRTAT